MLNNRKIRLFLSFFLVFMMIFGTYSIAFATTTNQNIKIFVNGEEIIPDSPPYMTKNYRVMVPVRFAVEPVGGYITWDDNTQTATITKHTTKVTITIGKTTANIDGNAVNLDQAAELKNYRTYVPLRFVGESLDCDVFWDETKKAVLITTRTISENNPDGSGGNSDGNSGNSGSETTRPPANPNFQYLGYYYSASSLGNTEEYIGEMTGTIHFGYQLEADGTVREKDNFSADKFHAAGGGYEVAEKAGQDSYMLVTGFQKSKVTAVLSNKDLRAKAINQINDYIKARKLDGVDLDFESVDSSQRENFVLFVKELREKIGNDKKITLSLMPRSAASQTWLNGYDYKGLSEYADYIILMAYNEHYSGGSPGAVASVDWVEKVVKYTLNQGVSKEKIVVALGSYGYDWPSGKKGSSLTNTSARNNAAKYGATIYRDPKSYCLYYNYTDNSGVKHSVWFEDRESLAKKAALAYEYDLGGLAFWRLGFYTDEIWSSIIDATNHKNADDWLKKAGPKENFILKDVNTPEDEVNIENNGTFVPQS